MESRLLLTQVRDLFIHSLSVCLLSARRFHPLVHPKSSWCIRGKTRDKLEAMLMKARHSFLTLYFLVSKGGTSGHHQKQSTNTLPINGLIIGKVVIWRSWSNYWSLVSRLLRCASL